MHGSYGTSQRRLPFTLTLDMHGCFVSHRVVSLLYNPPEDKQTKKSTRKEKVKEKVNQVDESHATLIYNFNTTLIIY